MGLLRILLALSVALAHAGVPAMVGGRTAVQAFFLISGYLVSFMLIEQHRARSYRDFLLSRWKRIYRPYALAAAATLAAVLATGDGGRLIPHDVRDMAVQLANLTLIGQDWLILTPGPTDGFLLPQAWSLGTELTFYAVAPFLVTRPRFMLIALVCSVALRGVMIWSGPGNHDPWTYRFFPTELALFLAGAASHQLWLAGQPKLSARAAAVMTIALAAAVTLFTLSPFTPLPSSLLLLGAIAIGLPALFAIDGHWPWSRAAGEVSFPFYLLHPLAFYLLAPSSGIAICIAILACAIGSVAMLYAVGRYKLAEHPREILGGNVIDFGDSRRDRSDEPLRDVA